MKVPEAKIKELCGLIPSEAESLLEAVLLSTEFSCLSSEDYVCSLAAQIGDTLINTFKEDSLLRHNYALIPQGISVPVVQDNEGNRKCLYEFKHIKSIGLVSVEFQA